MATLEWHCRRTGGVTLVELLVESEVEEWVRIESMLEPVWPPRRYGLPAEGWDDAGFAGSVGPENRLLVGYATPAEPAEPPAEIVSADPGANPGTDDRLARARGIVRALGTARPARDVVHGQTAPAAGPSDDPGSDVCVDDSSQSPGGTSVPVAATVAAGASSDVTVAAVEGESVRSDGASRTADGESRTIDGESRRADALGNRGGLGGIEPVDAIELADGHADGALAQVSSPPVADSPVASRPAGDAAAAVTHGDPADPSLAAIERRVTAAEELAGVTTVVEAQEAIERFGGIHELRALQTDLARDRQALERAAARQESLAARLDRIEIPLTVLERLA